MKLIIDFILESKLNVPCDDHGETEERNASQPYLCSRGIWAISQELPDDQCSEAVQQRRAMCDINIHRSLMCLARHHLLILHNAKKHAYQKKET